MIQIQIDIMQCILKTLLRAFWKQQLNEIKVGGETDIDNALELYNFPSQINGSILYYQKVIYDIWWLADLHYNCLHVVKQPLKFMIR